MLILNKNYLTIIGLIVALIFMYIGSTMFYSTGFGVTDLDVEKDVSGNEYDVSYMLRSVRNFDSVDVDYKLLSDDTTVIGNTSSSLTNLTDGSFNINETINVSDSSVAKFLEIKISEVNENNERNVIFEQRFDI